MLWDFLQSFSNDFPIGFSNWEIHPGLRFAAFHEFALRPEQQFQGINVSGTTAQGCLLVPLGDHPIEAAGDKKCN